MLLISISDEQCNEISWNLRSSRVLVPVRLCCECAGDKYASFLLTRRPPKY